MKRELQVLKESTLFQGVDESEISEMAKCMGAYKVKYAEGEFLFRRGDRIDWIGIVLEGKVESVKEDWWGNRTVMAEYQKGQQICCEYACSPGENIDVSMIAVTQCEVMLFNIGKVANVCPTSCEFHQKLVKNLMMTLARDSISLNMRLDEMSKRSTRDKICAFLSDQARRAGSNDFFIPYNRQEMADRLGVERSAMSGELGRMQRDGIIEFEKNHFILK